MAKNSKKRKIKFKYGLSTSEEIAVRNEIPVREAKEAYNHCRRIVLKEAIHNIVNGKLDINYFHLRDKAFKLAEEYIDNKRIKELDEEERLYKLNSFSIENELSFSNVKNIYSRFNDRLFPINNQKSKLEEIFSYKPELGNKAFDLTKKYFGIKAHSK